MTTPNNISVDNLQQFQAAQILAMSISSVEWLQEIQINFK